MRVLVTRPRRSAEKTQDVLRRLGHECLFLPMSEVEPLDWTVPDTLPVAIAATSAQALQEFSHEAARARRLADLPIYCVGGATAQAAVAAGFTRIVIGPGDGGGLAGRILQDTPHLRHGRLLYLAGTPRTPAFEARLGAGELRVDVAEVYRMRPIVHWDLADRLDDLRPDAVLFYSSETARLFFSQVPAGRLPGTPRILCLSVQVTAMVPAGCGIVERAERPEEEALLALLSR